jgi:hypothetical protein
VRKAQSCEVISHGSAGINGIQKREVQIQRVISCGSPGLTETVEVVPEDLVGCQQSKKRTTASSRNDSEQCCTMGIPALVIEGKQRDLANRSGGYAKGSCAPASELEDGKREAPAKLTYDGTTERAALAARERGGIAANAADNRLMLWRWWLWGVLGLRGCRAQWRL